MNMKPRKPNLRPFVDRFSNRGRTLKKWRGNGVTTFTAATQKKIRDRSWLRR